ncbi:MAG: toxin-antitoxin system protein [Chloroflexi bacterium]|nr:toxin-antitoxin system protein [Chloroflexota bacterium]
MSTTTIRVSHTTRDALQALAKDEGTSMQQIIERGIELYRRQQILLATNAAYAALRENKPDWEQYEAEIDIWDATLVDGLEEE